MSGAYPDPDGAALAMTGLRLAADRAGRSLAWGSPTPYSRVEIEAAAGEALFWTSVLHDIERERIGHDVYDAAILLDADGLVVMGLRWARHSLAHGAIVVHGGLVDGGTTTIEVSKDRGEVRIVEAGEARHTLFWRRVSEITVRNRARDLRPHYEAHVSGNWVSDSFAGAIRWFTAATAM